MVRPTPRRSGALSSCRPAPARFASWFAAICLLAAPLGGAKAAPPEGAPATMEAAKAEFDVGARLFAAKRYDEALPHFQRAYELSGKRPSAILSLAQCERALKRIDDALVHFREYLAVEPRPRDAAEVEEVIRELEAQRASQTAPIPSGPTSPGASNAPSASDATPAVPPPNAPRAAPGPTIAPPPSPPPAVEPERESLWSSPVVWVIGGAIVAGGAVAIGLAASSGEPEPYGGTTGQVLRPLGARW